MNAEEFKVVIDELRTAIHRITNAGQCVGDFNRVRLKLDQHRLEMEAAEAKDAAESQHTHAKCNKCHNTVDIAAPLLCLPCYQLIVAETVALDYARQLERKHHDAVENRLDAVEERLREIERKAQLAQPAITIKMRQHADDMKTARWECQWADQWVRGPYDYTTTGAVRAAGNTWLAALGRRLGIRFMAQWEDGEPVPCFESVRQ